jgi:hypothetical protein
LDRRLGGPQRWPGCCGEDKNLALPGIDPGPSGPQAIATTQYAYNHGTKCKKADRIQDRQVIKIKMVGHAKIKNVAGSVKKCGTLWQCANFSGSLYEITARRRPNMTFI